MRLIFNDRRTGYVDIFEDDHGTSTVWLQSSQQLDSNWRVALGVLDRSDRPRSMARAYVSNMNNSELAEGNVEHQTPSANH